jgi:iron complex transport system permease protein
LPARSISCNDIITVRPVLITISCNILSSSILCLISRNDVGSSSIIISGCCAIALANLTHWALGSFSGSSWSMVKAACILVIPVTIVTFFFSKPIGAYQLGEGYAKSLGINIPVFRIVIITLSSLLSSCVTALAGPISFVGIAVPHITRLMLKTAKPVVVIPACFLCGSVFCMFCDLIARTILSPSELAIGTVTAVFGAPVVIWLMIKKNQIRE